MKWIDVSPRTYSRRTSPRPKDDRRREDCKDARGRCDRPGIGPRTPEAGASRRRSRSPREPRPAASSSSADQSQYVVTCDATTIPASAKRNEQYAGRRPPAMRARSEARCPSDSRAKTSGKEHPGEDQAHRLARLDCRRRPEDAEQEGSEEDLDADDHSVAASIASRVSESAPKPLSPHLAKMTRAKTEPSERHESTREQAVLEPEARHRGGRTSDRGPRARRRRRRARRDRVRSPGSRRS